MAVNRPCILLSSGHLPHDDEIGFLVCGSVVRAPEGTFGAAIAEGGVADLLKVIGLSHEHPYLFSNFCFPSSINSPGVSLSLAILCTNVDQVKLFVREGMDE